MAKRLIEIDDETHVVVPRLLPYEAVSAVRSAMPVETRHWLEDGKLHAAFVPYRDCVQPQSVWDAALASLANLKV